MKLTRIEFQNFRSFGPEPASISLDPTLTFFVGKNHTGKSNIFKLFRELRLHHIPENRGYILKRANWFNYEAGVERPLKIKILCDLNPQEYQFLCQKWFLNPLVNALDRYQEGNQNPFLLKMVTEFGDFNRNENTLLRLFPQFSCILRLEFIRLSNTHQELNYSIQFNNFIVVDTADGRNFIQNIGVSYPSKYRESYTWEDHCFQEITKLFDHTANISMVLDDILPEIIRSGEKFVFSSKSLIQFYQKIFTKLEMFHSIHALQEYTDLEATYRYSAINKVLAKELHELISNTTLKTGMWHKITDLQKYFESMFESLNITFGIEYKNNQPRIQYYNIQKNTPIYNFDSIGLGITAMLHFLYLLIIKEERLLTLDTPEYQLHPHSQRHLYNLIKEYVVKNRHQMIIISHSPYFFQPDDVFHLRLFDLHNGQTMVSQVEVPRTEREYYQLKRNFTIRNRDAIFADGLIFVEGPTEEWAFPYFFRTFGFDLDLNNVSLVNLHGKGGFGVFWRFAHQLKKKFWFFFDNDVLGVKAGEEITQDLFKRSILYKNRRVFPVEIRQVMNGIVYSEEMSPIEFHEELELLRSLLERSHVFVLKDDFEGIFEEVISDEIYLQGSKVEKSIQLIDYLEERENQQLIPESLYRYIIMIEEELKEL